MNGRLLIVGGGGFGRELLAWVRDCERAASPWESIAMLDANPAALEGFSAGVEVIASPEDYQPRAGDRFACGIGDPRVKLDVCGRLRDRGAEFVRVVHPSAVVCARSVLGMGVVLCPNAVVTVDARLGDFSMLNVGSRVGHDSRLGSGCTLSGGADVTGGCQLGEGVFLGANAVMLPGSRAGEFARIGAGSVVYRRAPARATVAGIPAKRLVPP